MVSGFQGIKTEPGTMGISREQMKLFWVSSVFYKVMNDSCRETSFYDDLLCRILFNICMRFKCIYNLYTYKYIFYTIFIYSTHLISYPLHQVNLGCHFGNEYDITIRESYGGKMTYIPNKQITG